MSVDLAWNPDTTRAALTFAHPKGNLVTGEIVAALAAALEDVAQSPRVRLVTIEGRGPDFSFGASIPEHLPGAIEQVLPATHALIVALLEAPAPTAAIVRGRCFGGGFELALACDFVFAAEDAVFALPEIAIGVFPPAASVLLPQRVGRARATSAILGGQPRPAAAWQRDGLVELVAPASRLAGEVDEWFAGTLGRWSAEALRHAVRATRAPLLEAVRRELPEVERLYLQEVMRSHDAIEGLTAFLEKRPPQWRDA